MNIGYSTRLPYDNCAYPDKLLESTGPLNYRLNINQIHNCKRCLNHNGAGPRSTVYGFGDSTLKKTGYAVQNDLIDVDSIMSNRNVKASKCKRGHVNPINLTTGKPFNYNTCDSYLHPEYSRLSQPASGYKGLPTNRFFNLLNDPQANIFQDFQKNTRLEAKDNWNPEIPLLWNNNVLPVEYKGKPQKCGMTCE